jgi:putative zinc finger protein
MLPAMERAPLRPVPSRPPGPVDPAEAVSYVERALPQLDPPAVAALALVQLAGCSREEAASRAGMPLDEAGAALARARKELRRARIVLPGSGWCERAERMISDRFDDALEPPGPRRLEVHLRNCSRCVEHERRLAQAIDTLVEAFVGETDQLARAASYLPAPELAEAGPELAVVDAPEERPGPVAAPWRAVPLPAVPPPGPAVALEAEEDIATALAEDIAPAPPEPPPPAPPPEEPPAPEPPVEVPSALTPGPGLSSRVAWTVLFALAVALAVGAIVVAVLGALGGSI